MGAWGVARSWGKEGLFRWSGNLALRARLFEFLLYCCLIKCTAFCTHSIPFSTKMIPKTDSTNSIELIFSSLPHLFIPTQIRIITELTGLERGSGLKLLSTHWWDDLFYRSRKGTTSLFSREIIDHLVVFDIVERCPLREFPEHFLYGETVEVELGITEHRIFRDGWEFWPGLEIHNYILPIRCPFDAVNVPFHRPAVKRDRIFCIFLEGSCFDGWFHSKNTAHHKSLSIYSGSAGV